MTTEIYKKLNQLYKNSTEFYTEITTALKSLYNSDEPDFLKSTKWEFFNYEMLFKNFYFQFQHRFVRYGDKATFQIFLVNNMIESLYDLWIKSNWLNDPEIMAKLKDIKTRGNNVSQTNSNIQSPYPLDTKYEDATSETYKKNEPIQAKSQTKVTTETFDVISDFDSIRGDKIRDILNQFFQSFNQLFIEYYGLKII